MIRPFIVPSRWMHTSCNFASTDHRRRRHIRRGQRSNTSHLPHSLTYRMCTLSMRRICHSTYSTSACALALRVDESDSMRRKVITIHYQRDGRLEPSHIGEQCRTVRKRHHADGTGINRHSVADTIEPLCLLAMQILPPIPTLTLPTCPSSRSTVRLSTSGIRSRW